jgi:hypothetical protein
MSKKPGLNLADLAPMSEDVPVKTPGGDSFITVYGVSARDGLALFQRYPRIAAMMSEGFELRTFMTLAPDAISAIIAAATGHAGNEVAEENAGKLGIEAQWDILEAIGRRTFTRGFAPFAARIMALVEGQPSAPSTKGPLTNLPSASKPSSPPVTPPQTSGDIPTGN